MTGFSVLALAVLPGVAAPNSDTPKSETLVTAHSISQPATATRAEVTVVRGEQLRRTGERTLPRALGRAAGVWLQETNLGGGSVFLRGLTGNQVLIMIDGVRVNDSTTRSGPNQILNTIDPFTIERVEVIRGPHSVLYGSDGIGGVISIWTRKRSPLKEGEEAFKGSFSAGYDGASSGGVASASASYADQQNGWLAIGGYHDFDDLEGGDGETQEFTGYDGWSGFASWEHALAPDRNLRLVSSFYRDTDVPRTDKLVTGFGQTQPSATLFHFAVEQRERHILSYTDTAGDAFYERAEGRVSFRRYREDRERMDTGSSTTRFERDDVRTLGLGFDFAQFAGPNHLLTWGVDVNYDDVNSNRSDVTAGVATARDGAFAPNARYLAFGAFVRDEVFGLGKWDLTMGLRYSFFDFRFDSFANQATPGAGNGNFDAITASVQVARDAGEHTRFSASLAQGFRAPNLDDLAKNGSFAGGDELANADLDPERSLTAALALDAQFERAQGTFAVFHTIISDLIGRELSDAGDVTVIGDETYVRQNQGRARIYGAELGGSVELVREVPLNLELGATWTRGTQEDNTFDPVLGAQPFDGVPLRRVPPLHGRVGLRYERSQSSQLFGGIAGGPWAQFHFDWALLEVIWASHQGRLAPGDLSDPRINPRGTDSWTSVNLEIGGPLSADAYGVGSAWSLGVHNLFDNEYRVHGSGFDAPGVGLVATLTWVR